MHDEEGRQQRHRHGHGRNQRRPDITQEQENHDDRENGADDQGFERGIVGALNVGDRRGDLVDLDVRIVLLQLGNNRTHAFGHGDFGGAARPLDVEADDLFAIIAGAGARLGPGVGYRAEIAQQHRLAGRQSDAHVFETLHRIGGADGADVLLLAAGIEAAARHVDEIVAQGVGDVRRRSPLPRQLGRIELDADFPIDAAVAVQLRHALHRQDALGDIVVDVPRQLFGRHVGGADGIGQKRAAGGVVDARNDRILHVRRQVAAHTGDGVAHVVGGLFQVGVEGKLDNGGRSAFIDRRVDMAHPAQAGYRIFDDPRHLVLQFLRRGA